jgi:tetratricopeptide (TPR) repeat protein
MAAKAIGLGHESRKNWLGHKIGNWFPSRYGNHNGYSHLDKEEEVRLRIRNSLTDTFLIGMIPGFIAVIGFALNLHKDCWKLLFLSMVLALASFICGFFLGFLFGIPKRSANNESDYIISSNLGDISDWLTKIIIGLGLVEIRKIPEFLQSIGSYIQVETNSEKSVQIFTICILLYFSIFGLYFGYNYIRLFLSSIYKGADEGLNRKKLEEKAEILKRQDFLNKISERLDTLTKGDLESYVALLKLVKKGDEYTFEDWFYTGVNAYQNKDYMNCVVYMTAALSKDTSCKEAPKAYLYKGLALFSMKQYPEAVDQFDVIIRECKDSDTLQKAIDNKGISLMGMKKYDEAIAILTDAIKLDPKAAKPWYNLACAYALKKDKGQMLISLEKAIEYDSNLKERARTDDDLSGYRNDKDLIKLLNP